MSSLAELFLPRFLLKAFGGCAAHREMSLSEVQALEHAQAHRAEQIYRDATEYTEMLLNLDEDYPVLHSLAHALHVVANSNAFSEHDAVLRLQCIIGEMCEQQALTEFDDAWADPA